MKKEKKVDYKTARAVSRSIRNEFDNIQASLLLEIEARCERAGRSLAKSLASNPKALAAARRGLRDLQQDLKYEVRLRSKSLKGYHTEDALHRQFGLMTNNGIVKNR